MINQPLLEKPEWIKRKLPVESFKEMNHLLKETGINTVCNSASCPNRGECFAKKTATFMILGDRCTRNCKFCGIQTGRTKLNPVEPQKIAKFSNMLKLKHVVITSVTRDDLEDYGANQFVQMIRALKKAGKTAEVLIPDFKAKEDLLAQVVNEKPNIIAYNVEIVERLSPLITQEFKFSISMKVLSILRKLINKSGGNIYLKSGMLVGLGETDDEVFELIQKLKNIGCDMITIGQYLSPTKESWPVKRYVHPEMFDEYRGFALKIGIKYVESGPFVRSSYNSKLPDLQDKKVG